MSSASIWNKVTEIRPFALLCFALFVLSKVFWLCRDDADAQSRLYNEENEHWRYLVIETFAAHEVNIYRRLNDLDKL